MGMESYMGYKAEAAVQRPERLLPEFNIAGVFFHADIERLEFREVANPSNRMPIIGAKEEMGFSHFFFDTHTKNHYAGDTKMPNGIPDHVQLVLLPPLKEIDPVGLARQHGFRDDYYTKDRTQSSVLTAFSRENKEQKQQQQQQPISRKPGRQRL